MNMTTGLVLAGGFMTEMNFRNISWNEKKSFIKDSPQIIFSSFVVAVVAKAILGYSFFETPKIIGKAAIEGAIAGILGSFFGRRCSSHRDADVSIISDMKLGAARGSFLTAGRIVLPLAAVLSGIGFAGALIYDGYKKISNR